MEMKKRSFSLWSCIAVLAAVLLALWIPHTVSAAESGGSDDISSAVTQSEENESSETDLIPMATNNLRYYRIKNSSLAVTDDGFDRVFLNGDDLFVETYTDDFRLTGRKKIDRELPVYGGFYSGSDAYYLVFGQNNTDENTDAEVIRVVKYDKSWNLIGAASLKGDNAFGHQIRYPFDYGNVSMAECDGILYLVTGHEGYVDASVGQGHQGFLMFAINESSMSGRIVDADLWHSFSQHIAIKDSDNIYVLEESEGSEETKLSKRSTSNLNGTEISLLDYGGSRTSAWAVPTYASADAVAVSDDSVLAVGTSIDQTRYNDSTYQKTYNIYLTVTPMNNFSKASTEFRWVTDDNLVNGYSDVKLTKISNDLFMLCWKKGYDPDEVSLATDSDLDSMSSRVLHYLFLDGHGKTISREYTAAAAISECEPVVKNGKVIYYAADGTSLAFYTIDPETGDLSKKVYQTAGDHATWSYRDGVLTVSGTGAIADDFSSKGLSVIQDKVTELVLSEGITKIGSESFSGMGALTEIHFPHTLKEIGEDAFRGCDSLVTIKIPKGVETLGKNAFYSCDKLRKAYIPKSVTSIGSSVFSSGYYWTNDYSDVIYTTIYCETGSAALDYAKTNNIDYILADAVLKDKEADYTGSPITLESEEELAREFHYTYYTNSGCTKKTDSSSGAETEGGAPVNAGEYYVTAQAEADDVFEAYVSKAARLTIHKYAFSEVRDGIAYLKCEVCGAEKKANIPTSFDVWWDDDDDGYYSSEPNETQALGSSVECWIDDIEYSGSADENLSDMTITFSNPDAAALKGSGSEWTITWTKAGKQTVTVSPRYNPDLKEVYTVNVVKPLEGVTLKADKTFPQNTGSTITWTAVPDGGKGTLQYRFVLINSEGKETILKDYSTKKKLKWTADRAGVFTLRADVKDDEDDRTVSAEMKDIVIEKTSSDNTKKASDPSSLPDSEDKIITVKKPTNLKVTNTKGRKLKVSAKKSGKITGYKVKYTLPGKTSMEKDIKTTKNLSTTIRGLKKNKTYKVKVRAYLDTVQNGKTVRMFSKWTAVKSVRITK